MSAGKQNMALTRLHHKGMKILPNGTGRLLIALSLVLALLAPAGAGAQDVIVDPGFITGTVTTTLQDHRSPPLGAATRPPRASVGTPTT